MTLLRMVFHMSLLRMNVLKEIKLVWPSTFDWEVPTISATQSGEASSGRSAEKYQGHWQQNS